jgi:flagella basal body P-ring formation protein FlgA
MPRFLSRLFVYAFMAAAMVPSAMAAEGIVVPKPLSEINGPSIRLSDVFTGVPDNVDRPIATAPAAGKSVTYNLKILTALAEKYHLDWRPSSLADRVVLTRAFTPITKDMIETAVLDKVKEAGVKGKIDVLLDNRAIDVKLPANRDPKFALNDFDYDPINKRFRSKLFAETGEKPIALPVTGRVVVKIDVPVLTRRLESGTTIGKADIDWITVTDDRLTPGTITDPAQLVGREVRNGTGEGQPLHSRDVIPPRLVTRGAIIIIKIQTPHLLITTQGRAMQDGAAGDVVRVTNTQSKRVIEGTVDGAGVVRVHTVQRLALAQ